MCYVCHVYNTSYKDSKCGSRYSICRQQHWNAMNSTVIVYIKTHLYVQQHSDKSTVHIAHGKWHSDAGNHRACACGLVNYGAIHKGRLQNRSFYIHPSSMSSFVCIRHNSSFTRTADVCTSGRHQCLAGNADEMWYKCDLFSTALTTASFIQQAVLDSLGWSRNRPLNSPA